MKRGGYYITEQLSALGLRRHSLHRRRARLERVDDDNVCQAASNILLFNFLNLSTRAVQIHPIDVSYVQQRRQLLS